MGAHHLEHTSEQTHEWEFGKTLFVVHSKIQSLSLSLFRYGPRSLFSHTHSVTLSPPLLSTPGLSRSLALSLRSLSPLNSPSLCLSLSRSSSRSLSLVPRTFQLVVSKSLCLWLPIVRSTLHTKKRLFSFPRCQSHSFTLFHSPLFRFHNCIISCLKSSVSIMNFLLRSHESLQWGSSTGREWGGVVSAVR